MFLETNYAGPGLFDYHLQKNEYLAEDKELCNAYDQLQKDCEDLKRLMEFFSNEIHVNKKLTVFFFICYYYKFSKIHRNKHQHWIQLKKVLQTHNQMSNPVI